MPAIAPGGTLAREFELDEVEATVEGWAAGIVVGTETIELLPAVISVANSAKPKDGGLDRYAV